MANSPQQQPAHIFVKSMFGVLTILALGIGILSRGQKQKTEFLHVTGPITTIGQNVAGVFNRHEEKTRYIQVSGYPKAFKLFIGNDPGDFSPAFEKIKC